MPCILSSESVQVELLVVGMSTSITSSMQPVIGYRSTWFESWQPAQDTLSITFRQSSPEAHRSTVQTLRRWAQGNSQLSLKYPERGIDYTVVIRSIPWNVRYNVQLVDATVTFQLITNRIISSKTTYQCCDLAWSMLGDEFITTDIDDLEQKAQETANHDLVMAQFTGRTQFDGYKITYLTYPIIQIQVRFGSLTSQWDGKTHLPLGTVYTLELTAELVNLLASGGDVASYVKAHASGTSSTPPATVVPM